MSIVSIDGTGAVVGRAEDLVWFDTMPGEQMALRVHSTDVDGAFTIIEAHVPAYIGPPLHYHEDREEIFEILEGTKPPTIYRIAIGEVMTLHRDSPDPSTISPTDLPLLLQSSISAAGEHMHGERSIPTKLLSELRDAGAFSLFTPRELGGFEAPLTTALKVYEGFGRVDASVAWVVWNGNFGFLAALLDESRVEQIWTDGAQPTFANSGKPGVATPIDGGYHVSGHWKIVSGINNAEWLVVVAIVEQDGVPRRTDEGAVDVRLFLLRPDQLAVRDTWRVSGMRGSGSNDVVADDALVPADLVVRFDLPARIQRPLYQGFVPALVFPGSTAIALGVARSAIDEAVRLATTKKAPGGGAHAGLARVQATIARADADVAAARLLLLSCADVMDTAVDTEVTIEQRAALRGAMSHGARVCRDVLVALYELGSSSSLYQGNTLERLFRDGMAALQHANQSALFFEAAGRVRLGQDPGVALF